MVWAKQVISSSFRSIFLFEFSTSNAKHDRHILKRGAIIRNLLAIHHFCSASNLQIKSPSIGKNVQLKRQIHEAQVKRLKDIFRIKSAKAYGILKKYSQLATCDLSLAEMKIEHLEERGVTIQRILAMPWLLALDNDDINEKFERVGKALRIETFACAVPFFKMPTHRFNQIAALWELDLPSSLDRLDISNFRNRIDYLAAELKCESAEVADMMIKAPRLMTSGLPDVEEKLKILLDYRVDPEDIVSDPYVFMFTYAVIENKLKQCQAESLDIVKPWMLRCTPMAFNLYVQRVNQERDLRQGHKDIVDFLTERLDCQKGEVQEILLRVPSVRKASAIKLNEMIQFLYSHGFSANQIIEAPRVLGHSVETIDERLKELTSYGYKPHFLNVLCQTSSNYANFIRRLMPKPNKLPSNINGRLSIH